MSNHVPAVIQKPLPASLPDHLVPALIADEGEQPAGATSNSSPPTSRTRTRAGPMPAPAATSSLGAKTGVSP